jgi:HEAT repeat protein
MAESSSGRPVCWRPRAAGNDEAAAQAVKQLASVFGERSIPWLVRVLKGDDGIAAKHAAALAVSDLAAHEAVPALFEVIRSPRFRNHNGTFVYALWELDWSRFATELARLIADRSFEVREMAVKALESGADRLTRAQRRTMTNALLRTLYSGNSMGDVKEAIAYALNLLIERETRAVGASPTAPTAATK